MSSFSVSFRSSSRHFYFAFFLIEFSFSLSPSAETCTACSMSVGFLFTEFFLPSFPASAFGFPRRMVRRDPLPSFTEFFFLDSFSAVPPVLEFGTSCDGPAIEDQ